MADTFQQYVNSTAAFGVRPAGRMRIYYSLLAIIAGLATSLCNIIDSMSVGRVAVSGIAILVFILALITVIIKNRRLSRRTARAHITP